MTARPRLVDDEDLQDLSRDEAVDLLRELVELAAANRARQPSKIAELRMLQGEAALLPITQAAALLRVDGARDWIEQNVRIRWVMGQKRVLWGDVVRASEGAQTPADEGRALKRPLKRRRRK